MSTARAALLAAALIAGSVPATAGPPYVTDDPVPTDRGHWEIYNFVNGAKATGVLGGEAGIDLNYGAADSLQLTVVLPVAYEHDLRTRAGAGTVELAAKYRLVHAGDAAAPVDIAIFPRVYLASAGDGLGSGRTQLLLPVWIGRDFDDWSAFGGGGYQFNPGNGARDFWMAGVALTRTLSARLAIGAELYGRTAVEVGGRSLVAASVGVTLSLRPHWSLLASAGPGLAHARTEGEYAYYLSLKAEY